MDKKLPPLMPSNNCPPAPAPPWRAVGDQPGLAELLGHWLPRSGDCQFQPAPGGLTRSIVLRVRTTGGAEFALKGYPVGSDSGSLREASWRLVRTGCGLLAVPIAVGGAEPKVGGAEPKVLATSATGVGGEYVEIADGRSWQLFDWRAGSAARRDAGDASLHAGGAAIAEVHQAFAVSWVAPEVPLDQLACVVDRRSAIDRWRTAASEHLRPPPLAVLTGRIAKQLGNSSDPAAAYLAFALHDAYDVLDQTLRPAIAAFEAEIDALDRCGVRPTTGWTLRDCHRENLLFASGKVSAVIDCDAIRVDAIAMDLARWAVDFDPVADPRDRLASAVAGYDEHAKSGGGVPTTSVDRRLAAAILNISRPLTLVHWLVWLVRDRGSIGVSAGSLADRIGTVVAGIRAGPVGS